MLDQSGKKQLNSASDSIREENSADVKDQPVHEEEVGLKHEREVQYDAQEQPDNRNGLRKLLRRNPSYEFIRELAVMDETVLDQSRVKVVCPIFGWSAPLG